MRPIITAEEGDVVPFPMRERLAAIKWARIEEHLESAYEKPDLQAVKIVCAAAAAHTLWPRTQPVWLMVLGPPGTGKSSMIGSAIRGMPDYYSLSNLTPATLLSGWGSGKAGKKDNGLLSKLGSSILFFISDFSSITSLQEFKRKEVAAQLREIYDGRVSKDFGVNKHIEWNGKATMIVGATREAERQWAMMRDLGERFLTVRLRMGDRLKLAEKAAMIDDDEGVKAETCRLVMDWVGDWGELQGETHVPRQSELVRSGLIPMAASVAWLRQPVVRDSTSGGIVDLGDMEGPSRIAQSLYHIARAGSVLGRRDDLGDEDVALAARVAVDTTPYWRARLVKRIARASESGLTRYDLQGEGEYPIGGTTLDRHLGDLAAIGVLRREERASLAWYSLSDRAKEELKFLIEE